MDPQPSDDPGTRELLGAASSGDEQAWHALHRRYLDVLRAILRRHMRETARSRFDTDDILQSTFLTAYEELDRFEYRGPDSFKRWLAAILVHKFHDKVRYHRRLSRDPAREQTGGADDGAAREAWDSPSVILSRFEQQRELLAALAELPLEDQELIGLRFFERLEVSAIAARRGMGESSVRRHLLDALERLTRRMA
jgi:RNA polymerase sigma-70 factor (ECF subfamily)